MMLIRATPVHMRLLLNNLKITTMAYVLTRAIVAERTAVRDSLMVQVESLELGYDTGISDDELADIVAEVTLETSFDENISADFDRYIIRRRDQFYREDNYDDDMDFE